MTSCMCVKEFALNSLPRRALFALCLLPCPVSSRFSSAADQAWSE